MQVTLNCTTGTSRLLVDLPSSMSFMILPVAGIFPPIRDSMHQLAGNMQAANQPAIFPTMPLTQHNETVSALY